MDRGLVHIYHGDGKGKTTAALGLLLRSAGYGKKIYLGQFFKTRDTGELHTLEKLENVTVMRCAQGGGFSISMNEAEKRATIEEHGKIVEAAKEGGFDLVVLDEALDAYELGFVDKKLLYEYVARKPAHTEIVLTGRNAGDFFALADYVSHIVKEKHPYDAGIKAREGIEF